MRKQRLHTGKRKNIYLCFLIITMWFINIYSPHLYFYPGLEQRCTIHYQKENSIDLHRTAYLWGIPSYHGAWIFPVHVHHPKFPLSQNFKLKIRRNPEFSPIWLPPLSTLSESCGLRCLSATWAAFGLLKSQVDRIVQRLPVHVFFDLSTFTQSAVTHGYGLTMLTTPTNAVSSYA